MSDGPWVSFVSSIVVAIITTGGVQLGLWYKYRRTRDNVRGADDANVRIAQITREGVDRDALVSHLTNRLSACEAARDEWDVYREKIEARCLELTRRVAQFQFYVGVLRQALLDRNIEVPPMPKFDDGEQT